MAAGTEEVTVVAFRVSRANAPDAKVVSQRPRLNSSSFAAAATEERGWQNFAPYSKSVVVTAASNDDDDDGFCTARLMCIGIAGAIFYRHRRRHMPSLPPLSLSSFYMDSHCNPPPPLAAATTTTTEGATQEEESNMAAVPAGANSATAAAAG